MSGFLKTLGPAVIVTVVLFAAVPVSADEYYSKFGFWQHDVDAYQHLSYAPSAAVRRLN